MSIWRRTVLYRWLFNWPFDVVVGLSMLALGIIVIIWPDRGIAGYVQDTFRFPMTFFGTITVMCGIEVMYKPNTLRFALFVSPLLAYAIMSVPYFVHGLVSDSPAAGTTAVVSWCSYYWVIRWVNARRIDLIKRA